MRERERKINAKVCVLISGGLDSCVLLGVMAKKFREVFPAYVRCGLRWEEAELHWLRRYLAALSEKISKHPRPEGVIHPMSILEMPARDVYESHWSISGKRNPRLGAATPRLQVPGRDSDDREVYLPARNLLLLAKAAAFCAVRNIQSIAMGQLRGNPFPDAASAFLASAQQTLSRALDRRIRILTPFRNSSKEEVAALGKRLEFPLEFSFSCLAPTRRHRRCRKCNKCAEWEKVMEKIRRPGKRNTG